MSVHVQADHGDVAAAEGPGSLLFRQDPEAQDSQEEGLQDQGLQDGDLPDQALQEQDPAWSEGVDDAEDVGKTAPPAEDTEAGTPPPEEVTAASKFGR